MARGLLKSTNISLKIIDILTIVLCVIDSTNMFYYVYGYVVSKHMAKWANAAIEKGLILQELNT